MRTIIITITLCLLTVLNGNAQTSDKVYIDNFGINAGEQKSVSIKLANPVNKFCAFQFDLNLPNGIKVALDKNGKLDVKLNVNRKMNDHTLSVEKIGDGCYRLVCFSMSNAEFYGNEDTIVDLTVEATASMSSGTYTGSVDNIVLTKKDGSDIKPVSTTYTVTNILRGDVNGDGEVNVGDLVSVSNFMAGDESISKDAADVNKDGEVNVGDLVVISNIMSGNE